MDRHTSRGKWSQAGVPHKGWSCTGIDDLGEPSQTCEMCESVDIRYVHYMEHESFPNILAVGCVCAEHMEGDYTTPRKREESLRTLARRRKTWPKRKWRLAHTGNIYLRTEGIHVTIAARNLARSGWYIIVARHGTGMPKYGKKTYDSLESAKDAALPALLWAKEHL